MRKWTAAARSGSNPSSRSRSSEGASSRIDRPRLSRGRGVSASAQPAPEFGPGRRPFESRSFRAEPVNGNVPQALAAPLAGRHDCRRPGVRGRVRPRGRPRLRLPAGSV